MSTRKARSRIVVAAVAAAVIGVVVLAAVMNGGGGPSSGEPGRGRVVSAPRAPTRAELERRQAVATHGEDAAAVGDRRVHQTAVAFSEAWIALRWDRTDRAAAATIRRLTDRRVASELIGARAATNIERTRLVDVVVLRGARAGEFKAIAAVSVGGRRTGEEFRLRRRGRRVVVVEVG